MIKYISVALQLPYSFNLNLFFFSKIKSQKSKEVMNPDYNRFESSFSKNILAQLAKRRCIIFQRNYFKIDNIYFS